MQSSKWAEVKEVKKREKTHRTSIEVWGGAASECGWTLDLRQSVGWSCISLSSVRGGGIKVSLRMSFGVCEECVRSDQSGNLLKVKWKGKFVYGMGSLFYSQTDFYFQFDCIFKWCQTHTRV